MDPTAQGRPHPRKTLTAFDPLMLPTAASALSDYFAAVILAKVSGREVPMATKVIAVTPGLSPITQPMAVATEPTIAVRPPMKQMATKKQGTPPP